MRHDAIEVAAAGPRAEARRTRRGRRATSGRHGPSACPRPCGPTGRRAASSVAIRCGDPIWQTRSTWPMSMPSSSDAVATSAFSVPALEPRLGVETPLFRQAAVMRRDRGLRRGGRSGGAPSARPAGGCSRTPASSGARGRDRRGARSTPPRSRSTSPLRATTSAARCARSMRAAVAFVDDRAIGRESSAVRPVGPTRNAATVSIGFCVADSPMRSSGRSGNLLQPLERQRQMRAAPRADDRVNLVDDHGADGAQHLRGCARRSAAGTATQAS